MHLGVLWPASAPGWNSASSGAKKCVCFNEGALWSCNDPVTRWGGNQSRTTKTLVTGSRICFHHSLVMGVATAQASNVLIGAQGTASWVINCPDPSTQTQIWSMCTLDLETGSSEKGRIDRLKSSLLDPRQPCFQNTSPEPRPCQIMSTSTQAATCCRSWSRKEAWKHWQSWPVPPTAWLKGKAQLPWHCWRCDVLQIALDEAWSPYRPIVVDLLINLNFFEALI